MSNETRAAPPKECKECESAHNGINGRYCHVLNAYVEQTTEQRCKEQKVLTSKQQTEK